MGRRAGTDTIYITRAELNAVLSQYVTRAELDAIIADVWEKLQRRFEEVISDAMTACGKAWLPGNPAHIGEAASLLGCLAPFRDEFVAHLERGIVDKLREKARLH